MRLVTPLHPERRSTLASRNVIRITMGYLQTD